jgi:hypothetical protein
MAPGPKRSVTFWAARQALVWARVTRLDPASALTAFSFGSQQHNLVKSWLARLLMPSFFLLSDTSLTVSAATALYLAFFAPSGSMTYFWLKM